MSYAGILRDEFNKVIENNKGEEVHDIFFLYTYLVTKNQCFGTALSRWDAKVSLVCKESHKKHARFVNVNYNMIVEVPKTKVVISVHDQFGRYLTEGFNVHFEGRDLRGGYAWGETTDVIVNNIDDLIHALEELLYGWRWPIICLVNCATMGTTRKEYIQRCDNGWGWRKLDPMSHNIENKDIRLNSLSKFEWDLVGAIMRHGVYNAGELMETVLIAKQMILKYGTKECQRMMDEAEKGSKELHHSSVDIRYKDVSWRYNILDNWSCNQLDDDDDRDPVKEEDELVSVKLFKD